MSQEKVMIRYWSQDTIESGHWEETALIPRNIAEKMIEYGVFERGEIVADHIPDATKMIGYNPYGLTDKEITKEKNHVS
jgi:hypothetical protein